MKEKRRTRQQENEKPSVLLVTNQMNAGGAETHIVALATALLAAGCFVAVASSGGILTNELKQRGILHIEAPLNSKMPHRILKSARILKRAVKKYGFDILHAHARLAALACRMVVRGGVLSGAFRRDTVRFVTTAHLDFAVTNFNRKFSYWGERTLAVSEDLREYLIKNYGLSYDTIDLTVNGIDTDRFDRKPILSGVAPDKARTLKLVHVSRIDKDRALTAYLLVSILPTLLKKHRVHLTIVGGGELFCELSLRVERMKLLYGDCITLVGETTDVLPYLKEADIAIGVSRAALEAMSCRLPTVLSGNDGYLGIFSTKKLDRAARGNFCCRGESKPNENNLVRDLDSLLSMSEEERRLCGEEARRTVEAYYSLSAMTNDYLKFYERLRPFQRKRYNRHLILGYHGFGNAGDDAVLSKMIEGIRESEKSRGITVLSESPKLTEKAFSVRAVSRRSPWQVLRAVLSCEVLYVGGGTLLQSRSSHRSLKYYLSIIRLAKFFGKTVVYFANGIGKLTAKEQLKVARVLSTKSVISVRDEVSYYRIAAMLGQIPDKKHLFWRENKRTRYLIHASDSASLLMPCTRYHVDAMLGKYRGRKYFVVATNGCVKKQERRRYEKRMATAVMLAAEKGLLPVFINMHPKKDAAVTAYLEAHLKASGYESLVLSPTPREAMGVISLAEFLLSSRLHPLIFASVLGTRAVAYANDDKILQFAKDAFGEEARCRFDKTDAHRLTEAILSLLIVKTLPDRVLLFAPNPLYAEGMKSKARCLPEKIENALVKLALEKKKESSLLPKAATAGSSDG